MEVPSYRSCAGIEFFFRARKLEFFIRSVALLISNDANNVHSCQRGELVESGVRTVARLGSYAIV